MIRRWMVTSMHMGRVAPTGRTFLTEWGAKRWAHRWNIRMDESGNLQAPMYMAERRVV